MIGATPRLQEGYTSTTEIRRRVNRCVPAAGARQWARMALNLTGNHAFRRCGRVFRPHSHDQRSILFLSDRLLAHLYLIDDPFELQARVPERGARYPFNMIFFWLFVDYPCDRDKTMIADNTQCTSIGD